MFVICAVCSVVLVFDLAGWWVWCLGVAVFVVCLRVRCLWDKLLLLSFFSLVLLLLGWVCCLRVWLVVGVVCLV